MNDVKSVSLVDIGPAGRIGEPKLINLPQLGPLLQLDLQDPARDVPALETAYPDSDERARALVHYTLHWRPGVDNLDDLNRKITALFPRWYGRQLVALRPDGGSPERQVDLGQVAANVMQYLNEQLAKDPQKAVLLELAASLIESDGQ
jgi:hypothetical protein